MGAEALIPKSSFGWKATKKAGAFHEGAITLQSAKAEMKGDKIVSGEFVIDLNSMTETTLQGEYHDKFLGHVKSPDFFDTAKFPTAKLVIDGNPSATTVAGKLTIKDKTEPVTVTFAKEGNAYTGAMKIDRTKFGIIYNSENFVKNLVADKIINNDFDITFKVVVAADAKKEAKKAKKTK